MYLTLNVNTDAIVAHTARLETINKKLLPRAAQQSLNKAAFDVKTNTMPTQSKRFVQRSPTFFKATSKVQPTKSLNFASMEAIVGFMPQSGAKESGGATQDLRQQDEGGDIQHRSFIALAGARAGGSWRRRVTAKRTLAYINSRQSVKTRSSIVDSLQSKGKNKKQQYVIAAILAGQGGFVLGTDRRAGARKLLAIEGITRIGGNTVIKSTPIYNVKKNRDVKVKETKFMRIASNQSAAKLESYYIAEANKLIAKYK